MRNEKTALDWAVSNLVCPRDHLNLTPSADAHLVCAQGHTYPVVRGVPVMIVDEDEPTLWVGKASVQAGLGRAEFDALAPGMYLETLGIDDDQRRALAELCRSPGPVDPVVAYMVAATNGILYRHQLGRLSTYPIPDLRLPPARGERLLDIGCNWGRWSIAAAQKGYDVVGIDPSLGAAMAATRLAKELGLSARFVVADARRLPFRARSFDIAFSYSVLQHFSREDALKTLGALRPLMGPGGRVLIQMAHRIGLRSLFHQARRGFREAQGFDVRYWGYQELREAFEREIGSTEVSVDCYFGLGLQASDIPLMPPSYRLLVQTSEMLRGVSRRVPALGRLADSLYLSAVAG